MDNTDYLIVTTAKEAQERINPWLKAGWRVKRITAENVSIAGAGKSANGGQYGTSGDMKFEKIRGYIIIVLTIDIREHERMIEADSKYVNNGC